MPRFVLPLFPLFWAIADATMSKRVPHVAVVGGGGCRTGPALALFVNWYYIF